MNELKLTLVLAIAFASMACGCKKKQPVAPTSKFGEVEKKAEAIAEKEKEPEKPKDYPEEVYGDPEIFKEPRFQFVMNIPGGEPIDEYIYSMAMDGTDIRRVISKDIMLADVLGIISNGSLPSRSPDNRYLVFLGYVRKPSFEHRVILIDLKERTSRVVDSRRNLIYRFLWTPDSKSFYYIDYNDDYMKLKYTIATKELQTTPDCKLGRAWISHDGKYFLKAAHESVEIASVETCKVLNKIRLPLFGSRDFNYNFDTSLVVHPVDYDKDKGTYIYMLTELQKNPKQIKFSALTSSNVIIGANRETVHYAKHTGNWNSDGWKLAHHNVKTCKTQDYEIPGRIKNISIFNITATKE